MTVGSRRIFSVRRNTPLCLTNQVIVQGKTLFSSWSVHQSSINYSHSRKPLESLENPIVCQALLYLLLGWGTIWQFIVWLNRFIVRVTFGHFVDKSSCFKTFIIRCDPNFGNKNSNLNYTLNLCKVKPQSAFVTSVNYFNLNFKFKLNYYNHKWQNMENRKLMLP